MVESSETLFTCANVVVLSTISVESFEDEHKTNKKESSKNPNFFISSY